MFWLDTISIGIRHGFMWELWESVGLKMFWTHHLEEFEWLGWRLWHLWDDLA